jgi:ABC-2 type transport system permease protein
MRKYWVLYKNSVQSALAYRAPISIWTLGSILSLMTIAFVWLSSSNNVIGNYSRNELITYAVLGVFVGWLTGWNPFPGVKDHIKSGKLSVRVLLKPVSFYIDRLAYEFGWRSIFTVLGLSLSSLAAVLFWSHLFFPTSSPSIILCVLSLILTILLQFNISMCLGLLAFWVTELESINAVKYLFVNLLGGAAVPMVLLPKGVRVVVDFLPFRYMFSFPIEVFQGKAGSNSEMITGFLCAIFWVFITTLLYKFLWQTGLKKYSSVGN